MISEDIKALVHGTIERLSASGIEIHYPGSVAGHNAAAHDVAMVLGLLDGIVVCDAPCGIVRSGDHVVLEQRWRAIDPAMFDGCEIVPAADHADVIATAPVDHVEAFTLPPPSAAA